MNLDLLEILACPACAGTLSAPGTALGQVTLEEGDLRCAGCERTFPVVRGVPRMLLEPPTQTAENFGYAWKACSSLFQVDRRQFLDWIHPVRPEHFRGKRVLDLGCGKGRHASLAVQFGASRVVAVDFSDAVEVARHHTREMPGVDVIQADLLHLPFQPARFDYGWCVGVLHHLPSPYEGFRALARQIKPGGSLSAWVYAYEGNGWVISLVDPLRRVMRNMPFPVVRTLSRGLAWLVFVIVHGLYGPVHSLSPALAQNLFYADYMLGLTEHRFRGIESIVLDQLIAPITHYVKRYEFLDWFRRLGLLDVRTSWLNANSWRGFAQVGERGAVEEQVGRRKRS